MPTPNDSVTVYSQLAANGDASKIVVGWNNELYVTENYDVPLDKFVNPVAPVCVRSHNINPSTATMKRRYNLGALTLILLSDVWRQNFSEPPGNNGDWSDWENFVSNSVNSILSVDYASPGNIYFEIWNEPNTWPYEQPYYPNFIKTWKHAYNVIKEIDSNIEVVGPSFSDYLQSKMENFLDAAQQSNTFPDVASWHYPFVHNATGVETMANYMGSHGMTAEGIMITEIHRNSYGYQLAAMQRASNENGDFLPILDIFYKTTNGAMGGIISWGENHKGGYKRGDWWILKKFADMNDNSAIMKTDRGERIEIYATENNDSLKILLGAQADQDNPYTGITGINLAGFNISGQPNYDVYRLITKGSDEVGPPDLVESGTLSSSYLDIDWQEPDDSYYVEIDVPPPSELMPVSIEGPAEVYIEDNPSPSWTAHTFGGSLPYQYLWEINIKLYNQPGWSGWHSMGNNKTLSGFAPFYSGLDAKLRVTVTDANNDTVTSDILEVSLY